VELLACGFQGGIVMALRWMRVRCVWQIGLRIVAPMAVDAGQRQKADSRLVIGDWQFWI
jgi:hypothetical protein